MPAISTRSADSRRVLPNERRAHPRHEPAEYRSWLGWWAGGAFHVEAVALVDISRGGAQLRVAEAPPRGVPVWFGVHGGEWAGSKCGAVLEAAELAPGQYRLRLQFDGRCPDRLFVAALRGVMRRGAACRVG
jgi:hypothetical protein